MLDCVVELPANLAQRTTRAGCRRAGLGHQHGSSVLCCITATRGRVPARTLLVPSEPLPHLPSLLELTLSRTLLPLPARACPPCKPVPACPGDLPTRTNRADVPVQLLNKLAGAPLALLLWLDVLLVVVTHPSLLVRSSIVVGLAVRGRGDGEVEVHLVEAWVVPSGRDGDCRAERVARCSRVVLAVGYWGATGVAKGEGGGGKGDERTAARRRHSTLPRLFFDPFLLPSTLPWALMCTRSSSTK